MSLFEKFWHGFLKRPYQLVRSIDKGLGQPVLLIHGLGTDGKTWNPLLNYVDLKKWRLIGYDLLGFGQSPKPENNSYSVEEHAKSLLVSLDRETKNQKLTIIGHSMGCLVASHIAWKHPEMVKQLILYEPPLFADSPEFRSHERRRKLYFAFYEALIRRPKIMLAYSKMSVGLRAEGALKLTKDSWLPFERSLKNTIMKQTAYNELKAIQVPTDIIYGKFDFVVTRTDVKDMLKANQFVKFHLVNEMHDVTPRAARYIAKLLNQSNSISYTKANV